MTVRPINLREALLMLLTVSSGAVDAICFLAFGKVFSAFMTGNLVFLGIGAAGAFKPGGPNMLRVGAAIVAFSVGVFVVTWMIKRARRSRVRAHGISWSLGAVFVTQLGFLAGWTAVSGHASTTFATVLTAIEALAMGMQSGAVGSLGVKGVFTTAATGSVINLFREVADRRVSDTDPARNVRVLICLIGGAAAGGLLLVNARTYAPLVPTVATALAIGTHFQARRRAAGESDPSDGVAVLDVQRREPLVKEDPADGYGEVA